MKRSYFYLAASALLLSSCASETVLDDEALDLNEINFTNVVAKNKRSGDVTDLTGNNLKNFQVYGYYTMPDDPTTALGIFNDATVTRNNGEWTYTATKRYWVPGAKYYFYAYSCGDASKMETSAGSLSFSLNGTTAASRVLKINNYVCNYTHQHDLIFASSAGATAADSYAGITGKDTGNLPVAFQFKHILSKVNAKFTSAFPAEYEVEVSDVTIQNIRDRGNYSPISGWGSVIQMPGNNHYVYLLDTNDATVEPISTSATKDPVFTNSAFVIPYKYQGTKEVDDWSGEVTNTYVSIEFTVTVKYQNHTVLTKKVVGEFDPSWLAGYSYTYNITLDGDSTGLEAVSFTTVKDDEGNEVSDWNDNSIKLKLEVIDWEDGGTTILPVP